MNSGWEPGSPLPPSLLQQGGLCGFQGLSQRFRLLAARLRERGAAASAALDVLCRVADELHGVDALVGERLVEVEDEEGTTVVGRPEEHRGGVLLLPEPIGEVAEVAPGHAGGLDDEDVPLTRADF